MAESERLTSILSGIAGQFFVAAEISRKGHIATLTLRNTRGIDMLVARADGSDSVGIQVKTNQGSKKVWLLDKKSEEFGSGNLVYVFVNLNGEGAPEFHIVPGEVVADYAPLSNAALPKSSMTRAPIPRALDSELYFRSLICAPLRAKQRTLGVIALANSTEDPYTAADLKLLDTIALLTAAAIENAIASQQLLRREGERQALKLYLPPQVADLILASGSASQLEGVMQPITVLFADIRGFTTMSEKMEARDATAVTSTGQPRSQRLCARTMASPATNKGKPDTNISAGSRKPCSTKTGQVPRFSKTATAPATRVGPIRAAMACGDIRWSRVQNSKSGPSM